jgi:hypothetical protein
VIQLRTLHSEHSRHQTIRGAKPKGAGRNGAKEAKVRSAFFPLSLSSGIGRREFRAQREARQDGQTGNSAQLSFPLQWLQKVTKFDPLLEMPRIFCLALQ